ncbi:MAG: amidohydrolase family protein [Polyangiaceae bacterium]|nr:amidohydrolase family protein [Polyangiaceae bacterium]
MGDILSRSRRCALVWTCLVAIAVLLSLSGEAAASPKPADLVLLDGRVYTADAHHRVVKALAVRDGKLIRVGSNRMVQPLVGKKTKVIRLRGKLVLPGFIDAHCHPSSVTQELYQLNLWNTKTLDEVQQALREFADAHPDLAAITGGGFVSSDYGDPGPKKEWLDAVVPDRPVILSDQSGHIAWVNSKALELLGITKDTPDPPNGTIVKDPVTGEPWGLLYEAASLPAYELIPPYSISEMEAALTHYQENIALPFGITTVNEALVTPGSTFDAWEALDQKGGLRLRVRDAATIQVENPAGGLLDAVEMRQQAAGGLFRVSQVKLWLDGIVENHTAYLKEPYADMPDFRGNPMWTDQSQLDSVALRATKLGFQLHFHAIGDAAVAQALDTVADVQKSMGPLAFRPLIAHLEVVDPADYARMAQLRVVAAMQPYWMMNNYWVPQQEAVLGPERASHQYPMRSLFRAGVLVASGSDYYALATAPNPLIGIQIGVMREYAPQTTPGPWWPEERATRRQMVDSFTRNAAEAMSLDRVTGSLELGKSADLVILSKDIFKVPADQIASAQVLKTLFRGKVVYQR